MDSGVLFFFSSLYLPPHPPLSLCAVLVLYLRCLSSFFFLFLFFLFFFAAALDLSDTFNASHVMQVWLSVSVDRQPALKRCKCPVCGQRAW